MSKTSVEEFTATAEGMALFQQERLILGLAEVICAVMEEQGVSKADLAARLGKSRAYVTQLLDGRANMTLRTLSDVFLALGKSLDIMARDVRVQGFSTPSAPAPVFSFSEEVQLEAVSLKSPRRLSYRYAAPPVPRTVGATKGGTPTNLRMTG
jgi:transcriptional regulator with XRE-family HTH domain